MNHYISSLLLATFTAHAAVLNPFNLSHHIRFFLQSINLLIQDPQHLNAPGAGRASTDVEDNHPRCWPSFQWLLDARHRKVLDRTC
jgi:hypothetical protein